VFESLIDIQISKKIKDVPVLATKHVEEYTEEFMFEQSPSDMRLKFNSTAF
jgi:hypothetical protein